MRLKRARKAFTIRSFLLFSIVMVLLGFYLNALFYGENSIKVLKDLIKYQDELIKEKKELKKANQQLQKEYFELIKLNGY